MSIDIRSVTGTPSGIPSRTESPKQPAASQDSAEKSGASVSVELSSTAHSLGAANRAHGDIGIVDKLHVAEIVNALENGNYQIDDENAAEKIIELEKQLP